MVFLVIDEAGVGDSSLTLEGLMGPVGSSCKDGSLTDLANHQNLHHMQSGFTTCRQRYAVDTYNHGN